MRKFLLSCLVAVALGAVDAGAAPLVGTLNDGNGGFILGNQAGTPNDTGQTEFSNLGWAQPFVLNQSSVATGLTVYLNDAFDSSSTGASFSLTLTNMIGAGTTAANVLFTDVGLFPSTASGHNPVNFNLGTLALNGGTTYYIVLTSSTPVTHIASAQDATDFDCIQGDLCGNVGGWGSGGTLLATGLGSVGNGSSNDGPFLAFGSNNNTTGPALTDFDPLNDPNPSHANFVLDGRAADETNVPEPASLALLGLGLAGLGVSRRRNLG